MPEKRKKTIDAAADRQTMTELYETYEQKMFGIANAILHNDWQAEDAVHEAFVRMVPYLSRCKDVNDEKTKILIVRVIKSAAIDIYRKNKRENTYILDSEEDWIEDKHNPVEVYLATLSAGEMLKKIIGQVQAIDRMVDEDVPCEDVLAQINAAKSALHKAGQVVLEGHIKHCVRDGIEHGDADKTIESFTKAVERFANMR